MTGKYILLYKDDTENCSFYFHRLITKTFSLIFFFHCLDSKEVEETYQQKFFSRCTEVFANATVDELSKKKLTVCNENKISFGYNIIIRYSNIALKSISNGLHNACSQDELQEAFV